MKQLIVHVNRAGIAAFDCTLQGITSAKKGSPVPANVTVKTLARQLGISHMTVSRAINNHPNVSAEVRARVLALALESGYIQSSAAKALRGLKTGTIGLLLPNIVNDFYARFAQTFGNLCAAARLNLVIHLVGEDANRERQALEQLRGLHADAAVVVPTLRDAPPEDAVSSVRQLYLIRRPANARAGSFVGIDDRGAIGEAVVQLAERGHRKIAFLGPNLSLSSGRSRWSAYLQAVQLRGLAAMDPVAPHGREPREDGRRGVSALLAHSHPPTAILCGGVEIAHGALEQLLAEGVQPGERIAFIGYGDPAVYHWLAGGIATIGLPIEALAKSTFDLAIADHPYVTETVEHPARLIMRASAGVTED
jgi:DNA-binding LacI/PurR family transcriptional regulator